MPRPNATMIYRGWTVREDRNAPVTGRYRATRHGVGMCAGTLEALERMVDMRWCELTKGGVAMK